MVSCDVTTPSKNKDAHDGASEWASSASAAFGASRIRLAYADCIVDWANSMIEEELAESFSMEIVDGMVVSDSREIQKSNCETLRAVSVWLADAGARNERDVMDDDVFVP